jgi:ABC-type transporter Mla subunit MlaD
MSDHPKKLLVGLILGAGVILLLLAGLYYGVEDNPFRKPHLSFTIQFDDVSGVREQSRVTFLGIPAGYVRHLDYLPGENPSAVKVNVVITRKLQIPASVEAFLEPSLLGDASIALRPIKEEADHPISHQLLANGNEIRGHRSTKLEAVMPGFDDAMTRLERYGATAEQRLASVGEAVDNAVGTLNGVFLEKGSDGNTQIEKLVGSLQEVINGPEGKKDESVRGQLETIVHNLTVSSDNIRKLADVNSKQQGSVGRVLLSFEDTAKQLSQDAENARKVLTGLGHSSAAVTQASEQVKVLATKATEAVEQFHSRPLHYLTTTRPAPGQTPAAKTAPRKNE